MRPTRPFVVVRATLPKRPTTRPAPAQAPLIPQRRRAAKAEQARAQAIHSLIAAEMKRWK